MKLLNYNGWGALYRGLIAEGYAKDVNAFAWIVLDDGIPEATYNATLAPVAAMVRVHVVGGPEEIENHYLTVRNYLGTYYLVDEKTDAPMEILELDGEVTRTRRLVVR